MKTTKYLIILLMSCVIASCENESKNESKNNTKLEIKGQLVAHTGCKKDVYESPMKSPSEVLNDFSQVDYFFDATTNKLTLKHINSAFNCCVDSLGCNISFVNDTIIIEEYEYITNYCRCNCLYDLDMLVTGVEAKKYIVKIIEPYFSGKQKFIFEIDLENKPEGSFNIKRNEYPWDNGNNCDQSVIVSKTEYENAPNDMVYIIDMNVSGDCLTIKFSASGCSGNSWAVKLIDLGGVAKSNPCQRTLKLSLDNKEECAAVITKEISFNIEELQLNGDNRVFLNISGKGILYEY